MTELTGDNFYEEAEQAELPVLIDFYSPTCGPCRALAPIFEDLAKEHGHRWKFCKVNVAEQEGLAREFDILSVPTLIAMEDGEITQRIRGVHSKGAILEMLS